MQTLSKLDLSTLRNIYMYILKKVYDRNVVKKIEHIFFTWYHNFTMIDYIYIYMILLLSSTIPEEDYGCC